MKQMVPAPSNVREMLLAFSFYDREQGLPSLLRRIEFDGMSRRQVYFSVLGRAPENARQAVDGPDYNPRAHTGNALRSDEFQNRVREIVLAAFPEKKRKIFIHVPKCAGTDLRVALRRRYPYLHHDFAIPRITDKAALFDALHDFATGIGLSDSIAVTGHTPLRWYIERKLVRFEDDLFSTIRDPRDIMFSHISYVLTRLVSSVEAPAPDTVEWLSQLGMTKIETDPSPAYLVALGGRLLRSRAVTAPNLLCEILGRGTASSAIETIVLSDIEITDTRRYSAWRRKKFNFEPTHRINPSRAYFTPENAPAADRDMIDEMIAEDIILYNQIKAKFASTDALSLRGHAFG